MPASSKAQQRLMGMVHAYKQGKLKKAPAKIKEVAKHISDNDARDFAKTKTKKLPEKVAADLCMEKIFLTGFMERLRELSKA